MEFLRLMTGIFVGSVMIMCIPVVLAGVLGPDLMLILAGVIVFSLGAKLLPRLEP